MTSTAVSRSLSVHTVAAVIASLLAAPSVLAQAAPAPDPGAAPPPEAPPSEQPPSARTPATSDATPVQAAAAVEASPSTQLVAIEPPKPAGDPTAEALTPPGEKDAALARPIDTAKMEFKPGRGLSIKSADGDFELALRFRAQFLYTMIHDGVANETKDALEVRRLRFTMQGSAFGVHNRYYMELGLAAQEDLPGGASTSPVLDAYAEFDYLRDLTFRVGQYKPSFGKQRVMSEGNLELVEVSRVTQEFTFDRDAGLDFRSKDFLGLNHFRYVLGLYTGQGRNSFSTSPFKMLYLGRIEYLPLGLYEDYQEADFERGKARLAFGATAAHLSSGARERGSVGAAPADGGTTTMNLFEADAQLKVRGFSLQTEYFYRHGDRNPGELKDAAGDPIPVAASRDGHGWYGQVGYLLPGLPVGFAMRGGIIRGKTEPLHDALPDTNELGGSVSYYFARHPLKLQADYFRFWQNGAASDGNDQVRVQLQVAL